MHLPQNGGCQCGAIRYEITAPPALVYACHCTDCQSQSGSAFGMAAMMRHADLHFTRGEPAAFEQVAGGGRKRLCWFCRECGTRLVHTPFGPLGETYRNLKPGTLDDTSWLRPNVHFWTRSAQPWVQIPEGDLRFETQTEREWLLERAAAGAPQPGEEPGVPPAASAGTAADAANNQAPGNRGA